MLKKTALFLQDGFPKWPLTSDHHLFYSPTFFALKFQTFFNLKKKYDFLSLFTIPPPPIFMFEIERIRVEQVQGLFTELNVKQLGQRSAKEGAKTKWKRT